MKAQIEVEVKHADEDLYSVWAAQVEDARVLSPVGEYYWTAEELEAEGLPVPHRPVVVEVVLTGEEAEDVGREWGAWAPDSSFNRVRRKVADAVKKAGER